MNVAANKRETSFAGHCFDMTGLKKEDYDKGFMHGILNVSLLPSCISNINKVVETFTLKFP